MPARKTKDYYQVLKIAPQAELADVKKAYRTLAYQYHPDKNPDNEYAVHYFHEVQEAYEILSHPQKRAAYDEERWLAGFVQKKTSHPVTSQWIYTESIKLANHVATIDTYRMSHRALNEYVAMLLSDANMAVLKNEHNKENNHNIANEILKATRKLDYYHFADVRTKLQVLAGDDTVSLEMIALEEKRKKKENTWLKLKPYFIFLLSLLLCLLMIGYVRLIK